MYRYEDLKPKLFTEEGEKKFLDVREKVDKLLDLAGAFSLESAIRCFTGDNWLLIACVDRLAELEEIVEIKREDIPIQDRIFIRGPSRFRHSKKGF